jgi:hypothetical protein
MAGPTACGKRWAEILASFERNIEDLLSKHQDSIEEIRQIHTGLITKGQLINISPSVNGNGASWKNIISIAEGGEDRAGQAPGGQAALHNHTAAICRHA